jgi:hypothetical protein
MTDDEIQTLLKRVELLEKEVLSLTNKLNIIITLQTLQKDKKIDLKKLPI